MNHASFAKLAVILLTFLNQCVTTSLGRSIEDKTRADVDLSFPEEYTMYTGRLRMYGKAREFFSTYHVVLTTDQASDLRGIEYAAVSKDEYETEKSNDQFTQYKDIPQAKRIVELPAVVSSSGWIADLNAFIPGRSLFSLDSRDIESMTGASIKLQSFNDDSRLCLAIHSINPTRYYLFNGMKNPPFWSEFREVTNHDFCSNSPEDFKEVPIYIFDPNTHTVLMSTNWPVSVYENADLGLNRSHLYFFPNRISREPYFWEKGKVLLYPLAWIADGITFPFQLIYFAFVAKPKFF